MGLYLGGPIIGGINYTCMHLRLGWAALVFGRFLVFWGAGEAYYWNFMVFAMYKFLQNFY